MTTLGLHVVTNDGGRNIKESYNGFEKLPQGVENWNEVQTYHLGDLAMRWYSLPFKFAC